MPNFILPTPNLNYLLNETIDANIPQLLTFLITTILYSKTTVSVFKLRGINKIWFSSPSLHFSSKDSSLLPTFKHFINYQT